MTDTSQDLLRIDNLSVSFRQEEGPPVEALKGVSLSVKKGETLAIVGESGSGKSITALSVVRLLPYPAAFHPSGEILFRGQDLLKASEREMRGLRGNDIAMVFQEPMTSLNPLHEVGRQVGEVLRVHRGMSESAGRARTLELLHAVGIPDPETRLKSYPHQLA